MWFLFLLKCAQTHAQTAFPKMIQGCSDPKESKVIMVALHASCSGRSGSLAWAVSRCLTCWALKAWVSEE